MGQTMRRNDLARTWGRANHYLTTQRIPGKYSATGAGGFKDFSDRLSITLAWIISAF